MRRAPTLVVSLLVLSSTAPAVAMTSHAGWPVVAKNHVRIDHSNRGVTYVGHRTAHNKLLGGHGSDTLKAGAVGDVLWGDFNPGGQPESQTDTITGGAGKDFIYAGHGRNIITTGGGPDQVHAHFGRGSITCASPKATIFLSHTSEKRYKVRGCHRISHESLGR